MISPMKPASPRRGAASLALALLLAALTFAVFSPVARNGFISLDDDKYITENPQVRRGLTVETALWALTSLEHANWYPLRRLSHLVDVSLFGTRPAGHHLVSAAWHAAAAGLLFLALQGMTGARWRSAAVAGLFGIHPLQVESVAWAAERSNVQAGLFFALTLLLWGRYARRPGAGRYLAALASGLLGVVAKPSLVTLPLLLLLLDIWPLGRLGAPGEAPWRPSKSRLGSLLLEQAPLLAFAAASGAIAVVAHRGASALATMEAIPPGARLGNAAVSYWRYLGKTLWPADLAVYYPHAGRGLSTAAVAAGLLLAAMTAAAVLAARRRPWLGLGWLWFAGTLLPTSGIVQFGGHAMADRFVYIPCAGFFLALVWTIAEDAPAPLRRPAALAVAGVVVFASLAAATVSQVRLWRDDLTLYSHALAATSGNWLIENNLGVQLRNAGRYAEAAARFREALRINPEYADAHYNLGSLLAVLGESEAAAVHLREAIRIDPADADAHANLGLIYSAAGRSEDALRHVREVALLRPADADAHYNLGNALARLGRNEEALAAYREAIRLRPAGAAAHTNAGIVLVQLGRYAEAEEQYRAALRLEPGQAEARANLGALLSLAERRRSAPARSDPGPGGER
jgi:protein O-mannosyl-transferase